jgi:hypothetical protein
MHDLLASPAVLRRDLERLQDLEQRQPHDLYGVEGRRAPASSTIRIKRLAIMKISLVSSAVYGSFRCVDGFLYRANAPSKRLAIPCRSASSLTVRSVSGPVAEWNACRTIGRPYS